MLRCSMRSSIVDLLLLAILVQDAIGYSKSLTFSFNDDPEHSEPFQQNLTGVLQQNVTGVLQQNVTGVFHPIPPSGGPKTISGVFKQKFDKEMTILFSFLDQQEQCRILDKVSCNTSVTTEIASNFTELWKGTHCPSKPMNKTCYVDNKLKLKVRKIYLEQLAKLFISLPLPFKCLIIYSVASVSNYDTPQQQHTNSLKMKLQQAEQQAEKLFTSVKLDSKCSTVTVKKSHTVMQTALVNITVQLHNTTRKRWIKYFKKESARIFFEYMTKKAKMQQSSNSNRPVHANSFSKRRRPLHSFKKGSIRTDVRKVTKVKNGAFTMCFGIKVRSKNGEYKNWDNGKDIARSLKSLKNRNVRLKANILKIRKLKKSKTESLRREGETLLPMDIKIAKALFPMYLKNYYTRLKLAHKCYVMWMMSEILNKTLHTAEHLYLSLERLPKEDFCSRATRSTMKGTISILDMLIPPPTPPPITTSQPNLFPDLPGSLIPPRAGSGIPPRADSGKEETTDNKIAPKDGDGQSSPSTEIEIFALEIALFTLVAFMCIAILAFTISCVIFVRKSRSYANNGYNAATVTNNTVLARSMFSRVSTNVPNNKGHVEVSTYLAQSQNISNPLWACCLKHPQDSNPATSDRSTPQQPLNYPLQDRSDERHLQINSCEDTKTSCSRTRTLKPLSGDNE